MDEAMRLEYIDADVERLGSEQRRVTIRTSEGDIYGIYHPAVGKASVIWAGGASGGIRGPSFRIYDELSRRLTAEAISSLQIDYRYPGELAECVQDVLMGAEFLSRRGRERIGLVGHSFGGAVVIMAGAVSQLVSAVVGLSSQTAGATRVGELAPRPLLLVHGDRDAVLSADCSRNIYQWAGEPKELVIYPGNGHLLEECRDELRELTSRWLLEKLNGDAGLDGPAATP